MLSWAKSMGSCVVQDVVHLADALVPGAGEQEGVFRARVGESLLTAMVVCMFSDTNGTSTVDLDVLRVVMGMESLFQRCPSMVVLAGKNLDEHDGVHRTHDRCL